MENKVSYFFKALVPTIFILVLQTFLSMAMGFLLICKKAYDYESGGYFDFMKDCMNAMLSADFNLAVLLTYAVIALMLLGVWFKKEFGREEKGRWKLSAITNKPLHFGAGVVAIAFGAQYLCMYAMNFLAMLFPQWLANYEKVMESIGLTEEVTLPLVLYVVILGPICEEIAYRGLTMGFAKRFAPFWVANVIQAVLFAGLHLNPLQSFYTFFIGLMLGYFVHKSGSLMTGIVLHIAFNAAGALGDSLIVSGNNQMQAFAILFGAMVATYFGIILLKRAIRDCP
ncbi:MAG: type II CAAX endopeptidase family protein [Lachnospiraceae bacterium]|nr:type II CAAX endopeptidase family protein [Lachnospiraceae bacterium]